MGHVEHVADIPSHSEEVNIKKEEEDKNYEGVKILSEFLDVLFFGVDSGDDYKKQEEKDKNYRHQKSAPKPTHIAVYFALGIPMASDLFWKLGVEIKTSDKGNDDNNKRYNFGFGDFHAFIIALWSYDRILVPN